MYPIFSSSTREIPEHGLYKSFFTIITTDNSSAFHLYYLKIIISHRIFKQFIPFSCHAEIMDFGYPQNLSPEILKLYITQEGIRSPFSSKAHVRLFLSFEVLSFSVNLYLKDIFDNWVHTNMCMHTIDSRYTFHYFFECGLIHTVDTLSVIIFECGLIHTVDTLSAIIFECGLIHFHSLVCF